MNNPGFDEKEAIKDISKALSKGLKEDRAVLELMRLYDLQHEQARKLVKKARARSALVDQYKDSGSNLLRFGILGIVVAVIWFVVTFTSSSAQLMDYAPVAGIGVLALILILSGYYLGTRE